MKEPAILLVIFLKLVYSTMGIIDDANPNYSLAHRQGRSLFFPQYTVLQVSALIQFTWITLNNKSFLILSYR